MLNFTAGIAGLKAAAQAATLKNVLTSREFIEQGKLEEQLAALAQTCKITYLEDIRDSFTTGDKITALLSRPLIRLIHKLQYVKADDPAVVLFTSGSEGLPKASSSAIATSSPIAIRSAHGSISHRKTSSSTLSRCSTPSASLAASSSHFFPAQKRSLSLAPPLPHRPAAGL